MYKEDLAIKKTYKTKPNQTKVTLEKWVGLNELAFIS